MAHNRKAKMKTEHSRSEGKISESHPVPRDEITTRLRAPMPQAVTDEIHACCQHIATVAALLENCGAANQGDVMQSEIITNAGQMISEDVKKLKRQFRHLTRPP